MRWNPAPPELAKWKTIKWALVGVVIANFLFVILFGGRNPSFSLGIELSVLPPPLLVLPSLLIVLVFTFLDVPARAAIRLARTRHPEGFLVQVRVVQDGVVTGTDTGALTVSAGLLHFGGLRGRFTIGPGDLDKDAHRDHQVGGVCLPLSNPQREVHVIFIALENPSGLVGSYQLSDSLDAWLKLSKDSHVTGTAVPLDFQPELRPFNPVWILLLSVAFFVPMTAAATFVWFKIHVFLGVLIGVGLVGLLKMLLVDTGNDDQRAYRAAERLWAALRTESPTQ